jgi:predicted Zn-dependent peptidase
MVKDEKSALAVGSFNGFPGSKYPTLFIVFAIPNSGFTPEQMEAASFEEIRKIQENGITAEELARIKTQSRANFIRSLESNQGLAGSLAEFEILRGGWEKLFDEVARLEAVTQEQVQQAARAYLTVENSTVGHMVTKSDKTVAKSN